VPERWCFIEEVPKTSVGKFAKTRMRDAYARGDYAIIEARRPRLAPSGPVWLRQAAAAPAGTVAAPAGDAAASAGK